jgi:GxxExxY protein
VVRETGSKGTKGTKDTKGTKGGRGYGLRIPSSLPDDLEGLIYRVIGAAMAVHTRLGPGLRESLYRDALIVELCQIGVSCQSESAAVTTYRGRTLRRHRVDVTVENRLIVECKAVTTILPLHSAQLLAYLRATGIRVGLILNFNEAHLRNGIRRHVV